MIIGSANLNKRLGNDKMRFRAQSWLLANKINLLLAQEPWKGSHPFVDLEEFTPVGGNEKVFSWVDSRLSAPHSDVVADFMQRIDLAYLVIYNCYFDAYKQVSRASQLQELAAQLRHEECDRPIMVVGDFNLAPNLDDGLSGESPSAFNGETDRKPFRDLLNDAKLVDMGDSEGKKSFTIVRQASGLCSRFRCDLALVSDYIMPQVNLKYDHSIRLGTSSFTDHSGLVVHVPVTLKPAELRTGQLFSLRQDDDLTGEAGEDNLCPHKTAMARQTASSVAQEVTNVLYPALHFQTILDYGCGRGIDIAYYRAAGIKADGFDPHEAFGWAQTPIEKYDLITIVFVLNVLPNPWARLQVLRKASVHLRDGGTILVAARSPEDIRSEAITKNWKPHNDGYWSHEGKGTFQKGISGDEVLRLALRVGLELSPSQQLLPERKDITRIMFRKIISTTR